MLFCSIVVNELNGIVVSNIILSLCLLFALNRGLKTKTLNRMVTALMWVHIEKMNTKPSPTVSARES